MIQASGIDHIVLHVADVQRSKQFYTERLGMEVYRENDRQVFLHAGTQGVALFRRGEGDPMTAGGDMNHLALRVAGGTYESLKGELEAHGVAVSGRPGSPPAAPQPSSKRARTCRPPVEGPDGERRIVLLGC